MRVSVALFLAGCVLNAYAQDCNTWYESTQHSTAVFRNVQTYGAKGDGTTDDTAALLTALTEGRQNFEESTTQPAVVYFPPGTYLVSDTLPMYAFTHIIGNFACRPKIVLADNAPGFTGGKFLISASNFNDEHTDNFYHQIHNINIDLGNGNPGAVGIHWPVAQGTSLRNISINANSGNVGIFGENGGGGFIGDIDITGGNIGLQLGGQQFALRSITISNAKSVGFQILWDWVFSVLDLTITNCPIGFQFRGPPVSTVTLIDSSITSCPLAIDVDSLDRGILLDDVTFTNCAQITTTVPGNANGQINIQSWRQGLAYSSGVVMEGMEGKLPVVRSEPLAVRSKPTYQDLPVYNVYSAGAKGDGVTDDTAAIQTAINNNQQVFFPFGTYLISSTITLKSNTVLIGEAYSILSAKAGSTAFSDPNNPQPMISTPDDPNGTVQLSGLILATESDLYGCIVLLWRQGPGSGLWDVHYRMYFGAHTQLHVTGSGAPYIENAWLWIADHDINTGAMVNVTSHRGMLIDSQGPTYLYGTAVEHSAWYEFNFTQASNIYALMLQTEIPYWIEPVVAVPLIIDSSANVFIYGSGFYTWFHGPNVTTGPTVITSSKNTYLYANNVHNYLNNVEGDHVIKANYTNEFCSYFIADVPY